MCDPRLRLPLTHFATNISPQTLTQATVLQAESVHKAMGLLMAHPLYNLTLFKGTPWTTDIIMSEIYNKVRRLSDNYKQSKKGSKRTRPEKKTKKVSSKASLKVHFVL